MNKLEEKCVIHSDSGEIEFNGSVITLRPKTFELLLLLSSRPGNVISKATILENVWSDTVVEDQVVFQSINEIRKEFGSTDVIKTYPRRGYTWNFPNTVIKLQNSRNIAHKKPAFLKHKASVYSVSVASIVLIALITFFVTQTPPTANIGQTKQETSVTAHNGILILPFNVDALQESEKWIRFGALQGLISKFSPNDKVTVFQLEDTIEILNRLSIQEKSDLSNVFKKSGASLILKTSISGVPGDYNFVYSVFTPKSVDTKSINVKTINDGINTLASAFNGVLTPDTSIDSAFVNSQLQDNLIAKAIQFLEINDSESALAFLKSALIADKTNIYVHYLVAKVASGLGQYEQALDSTQTALKLINNGTNRQYWNRLLYTHGTLLLAKGNVSLAEQILVKAEASSKESKDWLYYSYSQSVLGKLHQIKGDLGIAETYYTSALEYQELLQCPMGIAQSHLNLVEYYLALHKTEMAMTSFQFAESLINDQKLTQAEPVLAYVKEKIIQYQNKAN